MAGANGYDYECATLLSFSLSLPRIFFFIYSAKLTGHRNVPIMHLHTINENISAPRKELKTKIATTIKSLEKMGREKKSKLVTKLNFPSYTAGRRYIRDRI